MINPACPRPKPVRDIVARMPSPSGPPHPNSPRDTPLDLSVVAPAHNEEDNSAALAQQLEAALAPSGLRFEAIIVDDDSTDSTHQRLISAMASRPWLCCIAMTSAPPGRGH